MYLKTEQQLRDALHDADKLIAAQNIEIERLRRENDNMRVSVHTCNPGCTKAGCVNDRLRAALNEVWRVSRDALGGK